MPGIVKVKVLEGRNLPVMDKSADTTDAYVEIKLGNNTYKTDVCRKSLNPQWNSEWYKFEMDDAELQDEPLQVRLMDHDTYSANDMIGKVYFNLNPLLLNTCTEARDNLLRSSHSSSPGSGCISGWFPVYDTIHGLRGEINLIIKLELFSDFNKFRQSSCGIHVFSCSMIPYGYYTENIYGFVEELVVEDDPEYQWIEKIRTPRASNEARQAMFYKMSGEVQRKIGLKVIELGGNAVIGYRQYFDLEGETGGVVVRGIGTAVKLCRSKQPETQTAMSTQTDLKFKIPSLTITSAFPNNLSQSDNCSLISLTESLRSNNFMSEIAPEDTWSLCSFASQTSCNSRYTSIETLLDQKNRKPIVKSGSKLLSVAKYFTTSKMRRKFSRKNKQKSLQALRKFSVIEECKQKSSGNLEFEIDEMIRESSNLNESVSRCDSYVDEKRVRSVDRVPSVEEYISCQIYDNTTSTKTQYFDLSDQEVNLKSTEDKSNQEEEFIFQFDSESVQPSEEMEVNTDDSETRIIRNLDECIISDDPVRETSSVKSLEMAFQNSYSCMENIDRDLRCSERYEISPIRMNERETISYEELRRRKTPPLSEMSPVSMSPPSREESPVRKFISEQNLNSKTVEFDKDFLRKLRRRHIPDFYPISASPEIRKLIGLNEIIKRSKSESVLKTIKENTNDYYDLMNDSDEDSAASSSLSSIANAEPVFKEPIFAMQSDVCYNNTDDAVSNNENNIGVEITTADIICNISPEALTPSCLFMHANNLDRNVSECEKECDDTSLNPIKRESVPPADSHTKKRPSLPDTSVFTKTTDAKVALDNVPVDNDVLSASKSTTNLGANVIHKENLDLMEYPFLTLSVYPEDFVLHLGGTVSARSVKLLTRISNVEEPETRDNWWTELRIEIKSHMRALACNVVLNYTENTSICDEVCVLSASGTAALVKIYDSSTFSLMENFGNRNPANKSVDIESENKERLPSVSEKATCEEINCSVYHIPYRKSSLPLPVKIKTCGICKKGFVADVMFVTIEPFDRMPVIGQGAFIHAFVYRLKRDCKSELNAREISDGLPFLEYELNRQLVNKLRIKGMNALFGLNVQVAIGEKMISAYATATAILLAVLPAPPELTVSMGRPLIQNSASKKKLTDARKLLEDTIKKNRIHYQLGDFHLNISEGNAKSQSVSTDASQEPQYPDLEYFAGAKQTCAIEVDDEEDLEIIAQLIDPNPPQGFLVSSTEKLIFGSLPYVPKKNIQLFTQVYRYRIPSNTPPSSFNKVFYRIVQSLYMKIHNRIPCSLNKVSFKMDIPEPDELQIRIVGMALALKESEKALESVSTSCSSFSELSDDLILSTNTEKDLEPLDALTTYTPRKQMTKKRNELFDNEIHITSMSYIPGASINFYLGNLNFVFIRESTMVKEQTGGVNNFVNSLLSDVTSIVKSHAAGIGGNAVVNFFVNECMLSTHSHKNQGQCLINVGGDVVRYSPRTYRLDVC